MERPNLLLTGLPGSGKTRLLQSLRDDETTESGETKIFELPDLVEKVFASQKGVQSNIAKPESLPDTALVMLVLDVRNLPNLPQDQWLLDSLAKMLPFAQGVLFNFVEAADLDAQSFWQNWLQQTAQAQKVASLPVYRVFYQALPTNFWSSVCALGAETCVLEELIEEMKPLFSDWQGFEFELTKVSLEHLMMGLANYQQSLGMEIGRISAEMETFEYQNRVALEMSPFNWQTFASEERLPILQEFQRDRLLIWGRGLDPEWIKSLLLACH